MIKSPETMRLDCDYQWLRLGSVPDGLTRAPKLFFTLKYWGGVLPRKRGGWEWYSQVSRWLSAWPWTPTSSSSGVAPARRSCRTPLTYQDLLRPEVLAPCSSAVCRCPPSASAFVRRIRGRCPAFRHREVQPRLSLCRD